MYTQEVTDLATALRMTAARLLEGSHYRWTHQGACNCGHLAQTLTRQTREEIHRAAVQKAGDWREHAIDYCPASGYPIDHILTQMLEAGLTLGEIEHLERLKDPRVVRTIPLEARPLDHRRREDVARYMTAWAALLESQAPRVEEAA